MKKKIAILTTAWSYEYLQLFFQGMQEETKDKNTDIYIFTYYNYCENTGFINSTGSTIFSIIDYKDYDGVILFSNFFSDNTVVEKEKQRIIEAGVHGISIEKKIDGLDFLTTNTTDGFYDLIIHLIKEHNIQELRYIGGNPNDTTSIERFETYKKALADTKLTFDNDKCFLDGDWSYEYGVKCAEKIFENTNKLPQGIVCVNDVSALGVLKVAFEKGIKIPEQVKIISYDNLSFTKYIYPSLSTVDLNINKAGIAAVKRILEEKDNHDDIIFKSEGIIRQSCGCKTEISEEQKKYVNKQFMNEEKNANFSSHLSEIEDVFLDSQDVYSLLTNLANYFYKDHSVESSNFALFLKSDWSSILINSEEELPENYDYGRQVQAIVNIHNGKKYPNEIIDIKQLIPENMKSEESNLYLFMPIFYHTYIHGYYVSKNSIEIIDKKHAFLWARNFGSSIERFRQKNMFKHMSQQLLRLSTKDALSGMYNRIGMDKLAEPFYKQNQAQNLTNILLFADINSMKTINDEFGHLHGDLAVKTVAEAILSVIPKSWYGIRYGGDEFLVIGNNKDYHGEDFCKMIADIIENKNIVQHLPYKLSASLGLFTVPPKTKITLQEAISKVDQAMYLKKVAYHKEHPEEGHK